MIRSRVFVGWVFFAMLMGCQSTQGDDTLVGGMSPDSLISEQKMVHLLAETHLIESALLIAQNRGEDIQGRADYFYQALYRNNGISAARYRQNLAYYQHDPETYALLYEKVIQELTATETKYVKTPPP